MRALETIRRAGERGGWRASAWFLERRYPDTWGPRATAWEREQAAKREAQEVSVEDLEAKVLRILGKRNAREDRPGSVPGQNRAGGPGRRTIR